MRVQLFMGPAVTGLPCRAAMPHEPRRGTAFLHDRCHERHLLVFFFIYVTMLRARRRQASLQAQPAFAGPLSAPSSPLRALVCSAATIVVFGLLPLQPQMLGRPDRGYDGITAAANRDLAAFVEAQGSPRLRFKGEPAHGGLRRAQAGWVSRGQRAQHRGTARICRAWHVWHCWPQPAGAATLVLADCSSDFLLPSGEVDTTRMPDGVHPAGGLVALGCGACCTSKVVCNPQSSSPQPDQQFYAGRCLATQPAACTAPCHHVCRGGRRAAAEMHAQCVRDMTAREGIQMTSEIVVYAAQAHTRFQNCQHASPRHQYARALVCQFKFKYTWTASLPHILLLIAHILLALLACAYQESICPVAAREVYDAWHVCQEGQENNVV